MALYTPGNEPDNLKKKLTSFLAKIDEYYPDKKVVGLHNEHKKLGERLTALYRELGYESGQEMLEAYGYEYAQKAKTSRSDDEKKAIQLDLINRLKERIDGASTYKSISDLKRAFPDLERDITNAHLTKQEFIDAGIIGERVELTTDMSEELLSKLKEVLSKYGKTTFVSLRELRMEVPESREIIDQLKAAWQNRGGADSFLREKGIITAEAEKTVIAAPPVQNERGGFERSVILGEEIRTYGQFTRQHYGLVPADYLSARASAMPSGKLCRGLSLVREVIAELNELPSGKAVSAEMLSEETISKMQCAASDLGFISARRLLEAYGYSVAAERSDLTAIVVGTDDVRAANKKEKRQISTYSERKVGYLSKLPVVTAIPDFKDKTFVLTGDYPEDRANGLSQKIISKGGFVRKEVSGKTDYLIAYDCDGTTMEMDDAIKRNKVRKDKISLILYEDIAPQFKMPLSADDKRAFEFLKMELPDYDKLFGESVGYGSAEVTGEYDV